LRQSRGRNWGDFEVGGGFNHGNLSLSALQRS
jgi:hypothetical protein